MGERDLVRDLPKDTRAHLCEELIEIILNAKKYSLSNWIISNILGFWQSDELITTENTLKLLHEAYMVDSRSTRVLLLRMGLNQLTEMFETPPTME